MRTYTSRIISLAVVALLSACGTICPGGGRTTVPRVLAGCLPTAGSSLGVTIRGIGVNPVTGATSDVSANAAITNPRDSTVVWTTDGTAGPSDPITGTTFPVGVTVFGPASVPDSIKINTTYTDPATGVVLTVTGTIKPPPPCTGSGTWTATSGGTTIGQGTWTIP